MLRLSVATLTVAALAFPSFTPAIGQETPIEQIAPPHPLTFVRNELNEDCFGDGQPACGEDPFPAATPASQGIPTVALARLADLVAGFVEVAPVSLLKMTKSHSNTATK